MKNYLIHHGIKGQAWGVRNGPPYPLDLKDHSAKEKKANWKSSLNKTSNTIKEKVAAKIASNKEGVVDPMLIELATYTTLIIGMFAACKIKTSIDKKKYDKELTEELYPDRKYNSLSDIPKQNKADVKSYVSNINPGFNEEPGTTQNCTFCTAALAMREKGYKAVANNSEHPWFTKDLYSKCFTNVKEEKIKARNAKQFKEQLEALGDGAYGNLSVYWKLGGGHSIFFKNEKGKVHIYDGQTGEEYGLRSNDPLFRSININSSSYIRLDQSEPTDYILGIIK